MPGFENINIQCIAICFYQIFLFFFLGIAGKEDVFVAKTNKHDNG